MKILEILNDILPERLFDTTNLPKVKVYKTKENQRVPSRTEDIELALNEYLPGKVSFRNSLANEPPFWIPPFRDLREDIAILYVGGDYFNYIGEQEIEISEHYLDRYILELIDKTNLRTENRKYRVIRLKEIYIVPFLYDRYKCSISWRVCLNCRTVFKKSNANRFCSNPSRHKHLCIKTRSTAFPYFSYGFLSSLSSDFLIPFPLDKIIKKLQKLEGEITHFVPVIQVSLQLRYPEQINLYKILYEKGKGPLFLGYRFNSDSLLFDFDYRFIKRLINKVSDDIKSYLKGKLLKYILLRTIYINNLIYKDKPAKVDYIGIFFSVLDILSFLERKPIFELLKDVRNNMKDRLENLISKYESYIGYILSIKRDELKEALNTILDINEFLDLIKNSIDLIDKKIDYFLLDIYMHSLVHIIFPEIAIEAGVSDRNMLKSMTKLDIDFPSNGISYKSVIFEHIDGSLGIVKYIVDQILTNPQKIAKIIKKIDGAPETVVEEFIRRALLDSEIRSFILKNEDEDDFLDKLITKLKSKFSDFRMRRFLWLYEEKIKTKFNELKSIRLVFGHSALDMTIEIFKLISKHNLAESYMTIPVSDDIIAFLILKEKYSNSEFNQEFPILNNLINRLIDNIKVMFSDFSESDIGLLFDFNQYHSDNIFDKVKSFFTMLKNEIANYTFNKFFDGSAEDLLYSCNIGHVNVNRHVLSRLLLSFVHDMFLKEIANGGDEKEDKILVKILDKSIRNIRHQYFDSIRGHYKFIYDFSYNEDDKEYLYLMIYLE